MAVMMMTPDVRNTTAQATTLSNSIRDMYSLV